jgi:capsular polysaccharide biosynthesis protein
MPRGIASDEEYEQQIISVEIPTRGAEQSSRDLSGRQLGDSVDQPSFPKSVDVYVTKRVLVDGGTGAVLSEGGALLAKVSQYAKCAAVPSPWDHPVFLQPGSMEVETINACCVLLATANSKVYYHWMLETMPLIGLLKEHQLWTGNLVFLLGERQDFQISSIEDAGFGGHEIVHMRKGCRYRVENLICATYFHPQVMVAKYAPSLREMFLKTTRFGNETVYIARKGENLRRIINEAEILEIAKKFGAAVVYLEGMSVSQQAALFHSAAVIIAPHGSALTNIVFCRPDTSIFELFSANYVRALYPRFGHQLGLDYWHMTCEPMLRSSNAPGVFESFAVDPQLFESTLDRITRNRVNVNASSKV